MTTNETNEAGATSSMVVSPQKSTLAVHDDGAFKHAMDPTTLVEMGRLAANFAKIQLCGVSSPEEAMARMLAGRELGLSAMTSLMSVYIVEGMPSLSAKLKQSLCLRRPDICEEFRLVESDNEKATFRVKRRGQSLLDFTYTIEDAKKAGHIKPDKPKSAWMANPRRMLEARAKGHAADVVFPDLLNGLATREEMEDQRIEVRQVGPTVDTSLAQTPQPPAVDVAERDYEAEVASLKEEALNATTKEARSALRAKIKAFADSAGDFYGGQARAAYNEHCANKTEANAPPEGVPGVATGTR